MIDWAYDTQAELWDWKKEHFVNAVEVLDVKMADYLQWQVIEN